MTDSSGRELVERRFTWRKSVAFLPLAVLATVVFVLSIVASTITTINRALIAVAMPIVEWSRSVLEEPKE